MTRTAAPKFTATRTEHGKTTRVTVRDADGNVTDTRNSKTMRYVEVLVTPEGKINTCSQKVGGTPRTPRAGSLVAPGWSHLLVTDAAPVEAPMPAAIAKPLAKVTAPRKAKATTAKVTAATIARDAGVDPYRFRCWLRSRVAKVDRTDIKAMRSAAKLFAREEATRRVK